MDAKLPFKIILAPIGIALLSAGLFFDLGVAAPSVQPASTPTADRLAEPTLPASPSQADLGAQVYWLSCMPCHGDRGQGLTDEFREIYPAEDSYCWASGCHGKNPYENGFSIPTTIPAVVGGPPVLTKFSNAAILRAYVKAAMPFWKPGSLTDEEAWQVTAFMLRESGLWDDRVDLNEANAIQVTIQAVATPVIENRNIFSQPISITTLAGLALLIVLGATLIRSRKS